MDLLEKEIQEGNVEKVNDLLNATRIAFNSEWTDYYLLKVALIYRQTEVAKLLITKGFRVNKISYLFDYTPLHLAINIDDSEIIEFLLNNGASVNVRNKNKESPLIMATKMNKNSIVDLMLPRVSEENCTNSENLSHMHIACMRNRVNTVKRFLQNGANINHCVSSKSIRWAGYTSLHFAVEFQCVETVEFLVHHGANITIKDAKQQTPLHVAHELRNESIIDLILMAHTYEIRNPKNSEGLSHFHIACTRNNTRIVNSFLQYITNVDSEVSHYSFNHQMYSPLHFAIEYNCVDVVKLLLIHGAKLMRDGVPFTPLDLAYRIGNTEILNLLRSKINIVHFNSVCDKTLSNFHMACMKNDVRGVTEFLYFLNPNAPVEYTSPCLLGCTPLHLAIQHKSEEVAQLLIRQNANITATDARGKTPLHLAFESDQTDIVDLILSAHTKTESNPVDDQGLSHFHISCTRTKLDVINHFLLNGVDVNRPVKPDSTFWPGFTPLHFAIKFQLASVVELLLKHNADITARNGLNMTPLDQTFKCFDKYVRNDQVDYTIFELLLKTREQKNIESFCDKGISLLHIACAKDDLDAIERYLNPQNINRPIDFDSPIWSGFTPLHFAAYSDHHEAMTLLLNNGANISIQDAEGNTPLLLRNSYHEDYISYINKKLILCDENPVGDQGISHFHMACQDNDLEAVQYFLERGVDVNKPTSFDTDIDDNLAGMTPLHFAVHNRDTNSALIQLLLKHGADVNARDAYMETPLHKTYINYEVDVINILVKEGADINARNIYGKTVLFLASESETVPIIVTALLEHGADINIEDEHGSCPLNEARFSIFDNTNVILILIKHIKKLKIIGYPVSQKNEQYYMETLLKWEEVGLFNELNFGNFCFIELNNMKTVKIDNYNTLYDILFKNSNQMSRHVKNNILHDILQSEDFGKKFPLYGYLLKLQFKRGLVRRPLLKSSKISLRYLAKCDLSGMCWDMILQHLTDEDLKNIINATSSILVR